MENIVVQTLCRLRTRISQHPARYNSSNKNKDPPKKVFFVFFGIMLRHAIRV